MSLGFSDIEKGVPPQFSNRVSATSLFPGVQKVYKVRIEMDLRRYAAPASGSQTWEEIYDQRTAVERVIAWFERVLSIKLCSLCTGKRAKVHFDLVTLVYNASKLAAHRISKELENKQAKVA